MKLIVFLRPQDSLSELASAGVSEVLIGSRSLSRLGAFKDAEITTVAKQAKELGLRVILLCDALVNESQFNSFTRLLDQVIPEFDAVRALDPGVMQYLFEKTFLPLHFVADTGNHNLAGLMRWESYFGARLERLVLSIELSKESLSTIIPKLKTPCELLVLGRILLFHSPRALLAPLSGPVADSGWMEAIGASEESPHKGFPLVENEQGSFMFLAKDFCLAEQINDLKAMGLSHMRFDPSSSEAKDAALIAATLLSDSPEQAKDMWNGPVIRGFYGANKSDVLFKKLKNPSRDKKHALAEVMDARKGEPMTVRVLDGNCLELGMSLVMINPEGKRKPFTLSTIKDLEGMELTRAEEKSIVTLQPLGSACVKALLLPS